MRLTVEIDEEGFAPERDWCSGSSTMQNIDPVKPDAGKSPMQAIINQILGEQAVERAGSTIADDHQILMEALEERCLGR